MAYLLMAVFYSIIDSYHLWTGAPFTYLGMYRVSDLYTVFHKETVPFVISLYLYFYKAEFHENSHEYTRGIGHYEDKINIRDSLTILCHCHYNEGTAKCQENKYKTRFMLMQISVYVNSETIIYCQYFSTLVLYNKCSKCPPFAETQARRRWRHCLTALSMMLPLLSDALSQLIQSPDTLPVDAFLEHAPHTVIYRI